MLALTAELVDLLHSSAIRPEAVAHVVEMTEDDYADLADELLADAPAEAPLHVFAYGSLLWKPAFTPLSEEPALAPGWHRSFRLRLTGWRGTPDNPGLMMVLDRGGRCRGIACRVPEEDRKGAVIALLKREMTSRATTNKPRWIAIDLGGRPARAIAFCADRKAAAYAGRLSEEEVVDALSRAIGHMGSCAEYLHKTIVALEARGIRDGNLWRLQRLVAARIEARLGGSRGR